MYIKTVTLRVENDNVLQLKNERGMTLPVVSGHNQLFWIFIGSKNGWMKRKWTQKLKTTSICLFGNYWPVCGVHLQSRSRKMPF